jgi:hypothetical protein
MKTLLALQLMIILVVCGCGREGSPVVNPGPPPESPQAPDESIVVSSCGILRAAADQFAAENQGVYPNDVDSDSTAAGNTLLDFVPGGQLPDNPFTKQPTVPINGVAANPGEIGYVPVKEGEWNVGYLITGFGASALIAELSNVGSPEDAKMMANCLIVQRAAEEEKVTSWGHIYPPDDDIMGSFERFVNPSSIINPFTGQPTYLKCRTAAAPGEIGYVAMYEDEPWKTMGYVITAYGTQSIVAAASNLGYSRGEAIIVSDCRTLQKAVEAEIERTSALCVDNIESVRGDLSPSIIGMLSWQNGSELLPVRNQSAAALSEASGHGRIAYEVINYHGLNVGYRITGSLGNSKVVELTNLESRGDVVVRMNALALRAAVENFASRNGGRYPEDVDKDRALDGKRVLDFMPRDGQLFIEYTGAWVIPANYSASSPGEIGYAVVHRDSSNPPHFPDLKEGYVITGRGRHQMEVVLTNLKYRAKDAIVLSNCRTLQLAAMRFAELNDGVYAADVACSTTPDGHTIIDLLPNGCYMMNPYTKCTTEPVDGSAVNPGETGYMPICCGGYNRGCTITGNGAVPGTNLMILSFESGCQWHLEP